jgi:hypothetical protein
MWWLVIILFLFVLAGGIYYAYKHLPAAGGRCVYVTMSDGNYVCNCSKGDTKSHCDGNNGIYDATSDCSGDFLTICKTQILGSCKSSTTCTYPTTSDACTSGTFTLGDICTSSPTS